MDTSPEMTQAGWIVPRSAGAGVAAVDVGPTGDRYSADMMFSMFALWVVVYVGVFLRKHWVIPVTLITLVWTLVLLKLHMTDPIPLNF